MARGSKNLKKRSGRRKASRRLVAKPYKGGFPDTTMRQAFDTKLTTAQNYERLGLENNPNSLDQLKASAGTDSIATAEFVDIAAIRAKLHVPGKKSVNHMRQEEIDYLQRLQDAHGDDFRAMTRDGKLNFNQLTQSRLENRFARWARWEKEVAAAGAATGAGEEDE